MCKWGTDVVMRVTIPAELSYTGAAREKDVGIDACIATIVRALNDGGVATTSCCCGHERTHGRISLGDGRELLILPNYESAQRFDAMAPADIHGKPRVPAETT